MFSVSIGWGASIELVDRFCYLRNMLSVDGSADVAVTAGIWSGWNNSEGYSIRLKGMLYSNC